MPEKENEILIDTSKMSKNEREAMETAEDARSAAGERPSFVGELLKGNFRPEYITPYPEQSEEDKKIGDEYLARLNEFLKGKVDPDKIDADQKISDEVLVGLKALGMFGLKIAKKYGGLGFSQVNYNRVIEMLASHCGSTAVLISAHQSIGVPTPLKYHGTEEQRQKFLPRIAKGAISAFALTEPGAGSDPAQMKTTATKSADGKTYTINGEKLWITNGPIAEIMIVMAQTAPVIIKGKERKQISAFIVESNTPGFSVKHTCRFMGLRGVPIGLLKFDNVKVPAENLIWEEGKGLKLALETLNSGRLAIPAASVGMSKKCLSISRKWANDRIQWGVPVGKHEAVASKLANMAANIFALESITWMTSDLLDKGECDVRIEAAIAKLYSSEVSWTIVDDTMQIRGGRGYETANSLNGRGEIGYPVERMFREARINRIIEGTSEIMRLILAREAVDMHMKIAGKMLLPRTPLLVKLQVLIKATFFYALWYPRQWINTSWLPFKHHKMGPFASTFSYVERNAHLLARTIFHSMVIHMAKLEKKHILLGRIVNITEELFVMSATASRAICLMKKDKNNASSILATARTYIEISKARIKQNLHEIRHNKDAANYKFSKKVLEGELKWLEDGIVQLAEK